MHIATGPYRQEQVLIYRSLLRGVLRHVEGAAIRMRESCYLVELGDLCLPAIDVSLGEHLADHLHEDVVIGGTVAAAPVSPSRPVSS